MCTLKHGLFILHHLDAFTEVPFTGKDDKLMIGQQIECVSQFSMHKEVTKLNPMFIFGEQK
jgi:hypothetical protein